MPRYLCNLIIPGAAKSGTSSLHSLLGKHPRIIMSTPKEPHFFSFDELYQDGADAHNSIFEVGDSDYAYFGESSQSYFVHECAIQRIKTSLDDPKIILLLRHPVERLLSHYRWRYKHTVEARPLLTAVRQSGLDTKYEYDAGFEMYAERGGGYIAFSKYSKYVPMWQDAFGKGNVLLLRSEDLKHLHQRVASKCFKFLGVPDHSINRPIQKHTTRQTTRNLGSMPEYFQAVASLIPQRLQHTSYYKRALNRILSFCTPTPPATISEETRQYIGSRLTNDIDFYENVDSV